MFTLGQNALKRVLGQPAISERSEANPSSSRLKTLAIRFIGVADCALPFSLSGPIGNVADRGVGRIRLVAYLPTARILRDRVVLRHVDPGVSRLMLGKLDLHFVCWFGKKIADHQTSSDDKLLFRFPDSE